MRAIRCYDLEIDTDARAVTRGGQVIHLTPREYAMLEFLAFHRGKLATRSMFWEHLYGEIEADNTSHVIDVYIRYLRNKIDKNLDLPSSSPAAATDTCSAAKSMGTRKTE